MRIESILAAVLLSFAASLAQAADLYPYHSSKNYCPAGLQAVQIGGIICCGTPNQQAPYSSVMAHPVKKKPRPVRSAPAVPLGKGLDVTGTGS